MTQQRYRLEEEWRPIEGWHGSYEVSNLGRVRSVAGTVLRSNGRTLPRKARVLAANLNPKGYPNVTLCKPGADVTARVHRLVALAFVPNPLGLPEVNHIDGNKQNNVVTNLEWRDRVGNAEHASSLGLLGGKLTVEDVLRIREALKGGARAIDLARQYGVDKSNIGHIKASRTFAWMDDPAKARTLLATVSGEGT